MIKQVRLFTGDDGRSHVEQGEVALDPAGRNEASAWMPAGPVRFQEDPPGSALDWHDAPQRQYVITLAGTLEFTTRDGETFTVEPGVVLLAEDTAGTGHRWRLVDDRPWQRLYVQLP